MALEFQMRSEVAMSEPLFIPGQVYRRTEIHDQYGGQRQGGISTPQHYKMILLITGDSGRQYGYEDGWRKDGIYMYTGEGQYGDMQFVHGNRAVRDHVDKGKSLHLFEQQKSDKRFIRYLGEMECTGFEYREAADTAGKMRQTIVFKLRPVGATVQKSEVMAEIEAHRAGGRVGAGFGTPENNKLVEQAAIAAVTKWYKDQGWQVRSVEADKCGYDLDARRNGAEEHVEVKGVQGDEPAFIITAGEVRNLMLDRKHVTAVVTSALSMVPLLTRFSRDEFLSNFRLEPLAYRATSRKKVAKALRSESAAWGEDHSPSARLRS